MIDNQLQSEVDREHSETEKNALVPTVQEARLMKYDNACRALAEASAVDEVKEVLDRAEQLKLYAKIADNKQLERDAAAIRARAERRLGEMMVAQGKTVGKAKGGWKSRGIRRNAQDAPTLDEAGINKTLAHRARMAAKLSPKEFERRVAELQEGKRGSLDIRRTAKSVTTSNRDADVDRLVEVAQAQIPPRSHRYSFLNRAQLAAASARYDGRLEPKFAGMLAIAARNVAARWTAVAVQFEQAARDGEEPAIASREDHEHDRG